MKFAAKCDTTFATTAREVCAVVPLKKHGRGPRTARQTGSGELGETMTEKREIRGACTTVCFRAVMTADNPIAK